MLQMDESITQWSHDSAPRVQMHHFNTQAQYLNNIQYPVIGYFSAWQLSYYIYHDPTVYGHLVIRDVGLPVLKSIIHDENTMANVRGLLQQVLDSCQSNGLYPAFLAPFYVSDKTKLS
jgi:hypothetical protein